MILDKLATSHKEKMRIAYIWLNHLTTFRTCDLKNLYKLFGDPVGVVENIYESEEIRNSLIESKVIKDSTGEEIRNQNIEEWYENHEKTCIYKNIKYTTPIDEDYPIRLTELKDMPIALYYKGSLAITMEPHTLGVVGSRRPTFYGVMETEEFVSELTSRGIVIVSGMAYGIDSKAHRAAIDSGGKTIAVLGGGVDICYPQVNIDLYQEISENHLLISEYEPGTAHVSKNFPMRNRIISGLSDGLLLVEAALRSGTLITADYALEQGKSIYGIPGRASDVMSRGVNSIIKQGAALVDSPSDIIKDIFNESFLPKRSSRSKKKEKNLAGLSATEKSIIGILGYEPTFIDDIIRHNHMAIGETIHILDELCKKDLVTTVEKGYYILKG